MTWSLIIATLKCETTPKCGKCLGPLCDSDNMEVEWTLCLHSLHVDSWGVGTWWAKRDSGWYLVEEERC